MSSEVSFEESKKEVKLLLGEIRGAITPKTVDESIKFLRDIDHGLDADLMGGKFQPSTFVELPTAVRVRSGDEFAGIYDLEIPDPPTYRKRDFAFFYEAKEGFWKIAKSGEVVARCADCVHFVPDKLGGFARPFEVAREVKHGMDSINVMLRSFNGAIQTRQGGEENAYLVGNGETLVTGFPEFARKHGLELAVVPGPVQAWVRVYHAAGGHVDLIPEEAKTAIPLASVEVARSQGGPVFDASLAALLAWMRTRRLEGDGFPSKAALAVMLAVSERRRLASEAEHSRYSVFYALRHFFNLFAVWPWGEQSVGRLCGRAKAGTVDTLAEAERILSDDEVEEDDQTNTASQGGKMPWHSRLSRSTLGQFRDLRRFRDLGYQLNKPVKLQEVDVSSVRVIDSTLASWSGKQQPLDNLDVMVVLSPTIPAVNLAVRVTESHKKLFVQELHRMALLLADLRPSAPGRLAEPWLSVIMEPLAAEALPVGGFLVFQTEAINAEVSDVLSAALEQQLWLLTHELQGFVGLCLRPLGCNIRLPPLRRVLPSWTSPECSAAIDRRLAPSSGIVKSFLIGLSLVADEPYGAEAGASLDVRGVVEKTLLKVKEAIAKKPLEFSRLTGRFFLTGGFARREELLSHSDLSSVL